MKKMRLAFIKSKTLSGLLFSILLLTLVSFEAFGEGTVKGMIIASDDNSPLIYATIKVAGTTIVDISDAKGNYTIILKEGTYVLEYSYIGYTPKIDTVIIENKKVVNKDIILSPMTIMGEEIIVTAQSRGQMAAVNQQVNSHQIVNVVSADRIRELPDQNAAQAISRLPGITLDGSKVVIRGIESKMNKILINGIEMPSTEYNTRSTDLGMVSANMLSGIEVFKTLTPDMDADAIGGVVNLRLREAGIGLHASVTAQGTYNAQEDIIGNKLFWGDISNRFFNNKFGILFNVNIEEKKGGDDRVTSSYIENGSHPIGSPDVSYMLKNVSVFDQQNSTSNYGGSLVLDYKLPNGKLVYTGMLSHSTNERIEYYDEMSPGTNYRYLSLDHNKYKSLLLNNSLRFDQQLGIVKLDASVSLVSIDRADDYRYEARFKNDDSYPPFHPSLTTNDVMETIEPWQIYSLIDTAAIREFAWIDNVINPNQYSENQILADINLQIPLKVSDNIDINFKFGGKYNKKDREYNVDYLKYADMAKHDVNTEIADWLNEMNLNYSSGSPLHFTDFQDKNYKPNKSFMNNSPYYNLDYVANVSLVDEMFLRQVNLDPASTKLLMNAAVDKDDYWGTEIKQAGYAMAEINLGKRFLIIPGVRIESLTRDFYAYMTTDISLKNWDKETMHTKVTNVHIFPHFHARYHVNDWWDVRFSYNKTISRPDYIDQIPSIYMNVNNLTGAAGNPYIRPAISQNFDANFTFYTRSIGLITIGGYMKIIEDIFYKQATFTKNIPDSSIRIQFPSTMRTNQIDYYQNDPYTAQVRGLEIEWQSNFSWLPEPFNGIVLNTNYTHIWSELRYEQNQIIHEYIWTINANGDSVRSRIKLPVERDTSYVNRLLNQANDVANVSVGYDYKGFSARLSFRFQGNVISKIGSRIEENEYTNNIYAYDFVVKQKIPFKSVDFEVFFNAINFTNVPQKRYSIYPNKGKTNTNTRYTGTQFQLGLRIRL